MATPVVLRLAVDSAGAVKSLKDAQTALKGAEGGAANLAATLKGLTGFTGFGLVLGKGLEGLQDQLVNTVAAAANLEKSQLTIQTLLSNTGSSAGRTAGQIEELAAAIGESTLTSTSNVREAAARLLAFRSVGGEVFDDTLRLAQDLAAVGFGDLTSNVSRLAVVLQSPADNLDRLNDIGIVFGQTQKDLIRTLAESGRLFEAQRVILDEVAGVFGGAGVSQAGGLLGAVDNLSDGWTGLLEKVGNTAPLGKATDLLNGLGAGLQEVSDGLFPSLQKRLEDLDREISNKRQELIEEARDFSVSGGRVVGLGPIDRGGQPLLNAEARRNYVESDRDLLELLDQRAELVRLLDEQSRLEALAAERLEHRLKAFLGQAAPAAGDPQSPASVPVLDLGLPAGVTPLPLTATVSNTPDIAAASSPINHALTVASQAQRELQRAIEESEVATRDFADTSLGAFQDYADAATDAAAQAETLVTKGLQGMEEALVSFVQTGKLDFKSLIDSMVTDLLRLTIRSQILGPLAQALGGLLGGGQRFLTSASGGSFGVPTDAAVGLAHGGSFVVPGSGGIDNVVPIFRATPGERVTVTPRGQSVGGVVNNIQVINEAGAAVETAERPNASGGLDTVIRLLKRDVERDILEGGAINRAIASGFGLRNTAAAR